MMNLTHTRCPTCEQPIVLLDGGPERHGRFGWYVALKGDEDGPTVQLIVYAIEDTKTSALKRARLLLDRCPELAAYTHRTVLPVTSSGLTSRGGSIEAEKYPEGIA